MSEMEELVAGLDLELRRGTLVLCVLSRLQTPQYGYDLVGQLSKHGIDIDISTLYPLLRRLEKQGICEAQWETSGPKPRKYYCLTVQGRAVYQQLICHWKKTATAVTSLLEDTKHESSK